MKVPLKSSLNRFAGDSVKKYRAAKGLVTEYSSITKKASIQLMGSSGAVISGVPVSLACVGVIKVNQTAILVFTDDNSINSAIIVAVI